MQGMDCCWFGLSLCCECNSVYKLGNLPFPPIPAFGVVMPVLTSKSSKQSSRKGLTVFGL